MLKVLPIFLIGYVISSIFVNCMNYNTSYGRNKIVNILVLAAVTAAVPALVSGAGWTWFMVTGVNDMFGAAYTRIVDNLFLTIFLLFVTPLHLREDPQPVSRRHRQRNPGHGHHLRQLADCVPGMM